MTMKYEATENVSKENSHVMWTNVLLTDSGFFNPFNLRQPFHAIIDRFSEMVGRPFSDARVLFIPTAAYDDEAQKIAFLLRKELMWMGFKPENITTYNLDGKMTKDMALTYDIMYFSGGWAGHLLKEIRRTEFDEIIKALVFENKVYVGMSAGSIVATPNIMGCFGQPNNPETEGLGFIKAYVDCHCNMKPNLKPLELSLPHIMLYMNQALAVTNFGYELIEEKEAYHTVDWKKPPVIFVDIFNDKI